MQMKTRPMVIYSENNNVRKVFTGLQLLSAILYFQAVMKNWTTINAVKMVIGVMVVTRLMHRGRTSKVKSLLDDG